MTKRQFGGLAMLLSLVGAFVTVGFLSNGYPVLFAVLIGLAVIGAILWVVVSLWLITDP